MISEAASPRVFMSLIFCLLSILSLGTYAFLETSAYFLYAALSHLYMVTAGSLYVPTLWFQLSFLPHLNLHKSIGKEERPQLCLNIAIYTCLTQNLGRLRFRLLGGWGTPHAFCARCVSKGMREVIVSGMLDVSLGDLSIAEGDVLHGLRFAWHQSENLTLNICRDVHIKKGNSYSEGILVRRYLFICFHLLAGLKGIFWWILSYILSVCIGFSHQVFVTSFS